MFCKPLLPHSKSFFLDLVQNLNISNRENAEQFCARIQVGNLCYQKKLHDLVFSGDIITGNLLKNVRVTVVSSRSKGFTPWKRALQAHFDLRKEVVKLKVKAFIFPLNTYEKYYIDIRETSSNLSMGDLRRIALREVAKMHRPTFKVDPAPINTIKYSHIPKPKDLNSLLSSQTVPTDARVVH